MSAPDTHAGRRILAVSSGGENWAQLLLVAQAFDPELVTFAAAVTADELSPAGSQLVSIADFRLLAPCGLVPSALKLVRLLVRERYGLIVTTGAAPGLLAILLGRLCGIRTVWIESIVNARDLSLSGKLAGLFATHWLTQWPHLERPNGPKFEGAVL